MNKKLKINFRKSLCALSVISLFSSYYSPAFAAKNETDFRAQELFFDYTKLESLDELKKSVRPKAEAQAFLNYYNSLSSQTREIMALTSDESINPRGADLESVYAYLNNDRIPVKEKLPFVYSLSKIILQSGGRVSMRKQIKKLALEKHSYSPRPLQFTGGSWIDGSIDAVFLLSDYVWRGKKETDAKNNKEHKEKQLAEYDCSCVSAFEDNERLTSNHVLAAELINSYGALLEEYPQFADPDYSTDLKFFHSLLTSPKTHRLVKQSALGVFGKMDLERYPLYNELGYKETAKKMALGFYFCAEPINQTSLLRAAAGLLPPDAEKIFFDPQVTKNEAAKVYYALNAGPQNEAYKGVLKDAHGREIAVKPLQLPEDKTLTDLFFENMKDQNPLNIVLSGILAAQAYQGAKQIYEIHKLKNIMRAHGNFMRDPRFNRTVQDAEYTLVETKALSGTKSNAGKSAKDISYEFTIDPRGNLVSETAPKTQSIKVSPKRTAAKDVKYAAQNSNSASVFKKADGVSGKNSDADIEKKLLRLIEEVKESKTKTFGVIFHVNDLNNDLQRASVNLYSKTRFVLKGLPPGYARHPLVAELKYAVTNTTPPEHGKRYLVLLKELDSFTSFTPDYAKIKVKMEEASAQQDPARRNEILENVLKEFDALEISVKNGFGKAFLNRLSDVRDIIVGLKEGPEVYTALSLLKEIASIKKRTGGALNFYPLNKTPLEKEATNTLMKARAALAKIAPGTEIYNELAKAIKNDIKPNESRKFMLRQAQAAALYPMEAEVAQLKWRMEDIFEKTADLEERDKLLSVLVSDNKNLDAKAFVKGGSAGRETTVQLKFLRQEIVKRTQETAAADAMINKRQRKIIEKYIERINEYKKQTHGVIRFTNKLSPLEQECAKVESSARSLLFRLPVSSSYTLRLKNALKNDITEGKYRKIIAAENAQREAVAAEEKKQTISRIVGGLWNNAAQKAAGKADVTPAQTEERPRRRFKPETEKRKIIEKLDNEKSVSKEEIENTGLNPLDKFELEQEAKALGLFIAAPQKRGIARLVSDAEKYFEENPKMPLPESVFRALQNIKNNPRAVHRKSDLDKIKILLDVNAKIQAPLSNRAAQKWIDAANEHYAKSPKTPLPSNVLLGLRNIKNIHVAATNAQRQEAETLIVKNVKKSAVYSGKALKKWINAAEKHYKNNQGESLPAKILHGLKTTKPANEIQRIKKDELVARNPVKFIPFKAAQKWIDAASRHYEYSARNLHEDVRMGLEHIKRGGIVATQEQLAQAQALLDKQPGKFVPGKTAQGWIDLAVKHYKERHGVQLPKDIRVALQNIKNGTMSVTGENQRGMAAGLLAADPRPVFTPGAAAQKWIDAAKKHYLENPGQRLPNNIYNALSHIKNGDAISTDAQKKEAAYLFSKNSAK